MKRRILIIDDDIDIQNAMKVVIEKDGHEVFTAEDGPSGIAAAKAHQPDLILLDVMMNYQDEGFQTAYQMRQDDELKAIPIVMITSVGKVTGFDFNKNKDSDFLPVEDFIEKPVDPEKLRNLVRKYLGN